MNTDEPDRSPAGASSPQLSPVVPSGAQLSAAGLNGTQRALPVVMGIVNVTDDSFSGDGLNGDPAGAIARARAMAEAGAGIIDLGAESTRPGAAVVTADEDSPGRLTRIAVVDPPYCEP